MATKAQREKRFHVELAKQMLALATSGFGLVAALAWNSLIQEFVNNYVKKWIPGEEGGIISLFVYALLITLLAVFITYQLSKLGGRLQEN